MNESTIVELVNRISNNSMAILARTTNHGVTGDNAEELLAIARKMRNDQDRLGKLLEDAANGRGLALADSIQTEPLATIGRQS